MPRPRSSIFLFMHCGTCLQTKPANQSRSEYNRTETGLTPSGIEIWCRRCRKQVAHFTPDQLRDVLDDPPACDCCPGGKHLRPGPTIN